MNFFQQIFRRYLQRQSDEQENKLVDRWYEATGKGRRPGWMSSKLIQDKKHDTWRKMTLRLALEEAAGNKTRLLVSKQIQPLWRYLAAAMVIGLGIWGTLHLFTPRQNEKQRYAQLETYSAEQGVRKYLKLSDGTEVWLNNGSMLQVRRSIRGDSTREVWLAEGEAYFKVARDPHKPFIVHVDSLQTRVLGTAFNIQAYRELPRLQVMVTEGKVLVRDPARVLDSLTRDDQLTYHPATGDFAITHTEMQSQNGWWNNRFVLDKAAFDELALRLRLRYNVKLISKNQRIRQTAFTANFPQTASLESVLETLCTLYSTHYSRKEDIVTIY